MEAPGRVWLGVGVSLQYCGGSTRPLSLSRWHQLFPPCTHHKCLPCFGCIDQLTFTAPIISQVRLGNSKFEFGAAQSISSAQWALGSTIMLAARNDVPSLDFAVNSSISYRAQDLWEIGSRTEVPHGASLFSAQTWAFCKVCAHSIFHKYACIYTCVSEYVCMCLWLRGWWSRTLGLWFAMHTLYHWATLPVPRNSLQNSSTTAGKMHIQRLLKTNPTHRPQGSG